MREFTVKAKLLACRNGSYTVYVFKNLDEDQYIMCTKPPNWQTPNIDIEEEGFLHYKEVIAGEKYYDVDHEDMTAYKYSNLYFMDFVKISNITNTEIIL